MTNAPARLSTKHALALTNRGGATAADVIALARTVRDGVRATFGIELTPEPMPDWRRRSRYLWNT